MCILNVRRAVHRGLSLREGVLARASAERPRATPRTQKKGTHRHTTDTEQTTRTHCAVSVTTRNRTPSLIQSFRERTSATRSTKHDTRLCPHESVLQPSLFSLREELQSRTGFVPSFACHFGRLKLPCIIVTRYGVSLRFFFLRYLEELLRLSELDDGDTIQMPEALVVWDLGHGHYLDGTVSAFFNLSFSFPSLHFEPYCFPDSRAHALRSNSVVRRYSSYVSLALLEVFWKCLRFQRVIVIG